MEVIPSNEIKTRIQRMRIVNLLYGFSQATMALNMLYLRVYGLSATTIGVIMTIAMLLSTITPPMWGALADSIRSRYKVFVIVSILSAVFNGLMPIGGIIHLGKALILGAILVPLVNALIGNMMSLLDTCSVTASAVVPGMYYSNLRMYVSFGFAVCNLVYTPLINLFGIWFPYCTTVLFILLLLARTKELKRYETVEQKHEDQPKEKLDFSLIFKNYYLITFLILGILLFLSQNAGMMMIYLLENIGASTSLQASITGLGVLFQCLSMLFIPRLRRTFSLPVLLIIGALFFSVGFFWSSVSRTLFEVIASSCVTQLGFGLNLGCAINCIFTLCPKGLEATSVSLWATAMGIANMIVNLIGGSLVDAGKLRLVYTLCAGSAILWIVLYIAAVFIGEKLLKKDNPIPLFRPADAPPLPLRSGLIPEDPGQL